MVSEEPVVGTSRGRRDLGGWGKEEATLETKIQMQYSPKPEAEKESARWSSMNRQRSRSRSFKETWLGGDQRTRVVGPFVGVMTDEQASTGVSAAQPMVVCERDDVNCGGGAVAR